MMSYETPEFWPYETRGFCPSPALARWLLWGAVAAVLVGCLNAGSAVVDLLRGPSKGFALFDVLLLAAIVPEVLVLAAFVGLANESQKQAARLDVENKSRALRYSATAKFLTLWLLAISSTAVNAMSATDASLALLSCCVLLLVLPLAGFSLWFGISLIRLSDRLGLSATVLGWMEILRLMVWVVMIILIVVHALALADRPDLNAEQKEAWKEQEMMPLRRANSIRMLVSTTIIALVTTQLFLSLRRRMQSQLVGQRCIVCKDPIRVTSEGEFCSACAQVVHTSCARSDDFPASPTHCPQCGGNPSLRLACD
jgi:hypothetical protein